MRQKPSAPKRGLRPRTPSKASPLPTTLPYTIDYKNVALLRRYIGITGKILPRARARAIRQARVAGRLPFVWLTE
jgi:ribosomal protein S18